MQFQGESVPQEIIRALGPPVEWRYEMRREAQEVLPSVFLGPYQASRDLDNLQRLGITHICCISETREAHLLKARFPENLKYLVLDIRDATDQNLISIFPRVKEFIDSALGCSGRVLVHCGDGLSRSPALMTAYVMASFNISAEAAFQFVQSRRFCVSPNLGFLHQLNAYEPICEAQRTMAFQDDSMFDRQPTRRKRSASEEEIFRAMRPAP
ncbi:protein-tyrosine phosphatase-like protein [Phakopsora pachyrhizi]|uniref:Protein-tyrosine phosphatase-like protein n=1 Tax=Phakopsora pachyrhizi TaxID=170000 RepID=A0AAV0AL81_PHAPC|nr:protein-tyrosine phosphatase-like protein [Phakopsora pachyrhizi]CAH7669464.1 protein-tyrosine phosphatase-like protein [Phakopsora pachyrhizi]CAH7688677.1 protein-tyrosine phosphatase-like protein [Phakopsora pachyrhizi]